MIKDEPEARRAKARLFVARCNKVVHGASWAKGDVSARGGVFIALELAEQAYRAHGLPYEPGLSKMILYDPRRFTWIYDPAGEASDCVKLRDNKPAALSSGRTSERGGRAAGDHDAALALAIKHPLEAIVRGRGECVHGCQRTNAAKSPEFQKFQFQFPPIGRPAARG